jgi:hypothetical protein
MIGVIDPARKDKVAKRNPATFKPSQDAGAGGLEELELDRSTGLLLDDECSRTNPTATDEVADLDFDDVATAQLAVDRETNIARSRNRRSVFSQNLMAQTCWSFNPRLAPTIRRAFHGRRSLTLLTPGSYTECPISLSSPPAFIGRVKKRWANPDMESRAVSGRTAFGC